MCSMSMAEGHAATCLYHLEPPCDTDSVSQCTMKKRHDADRYRVANAESHLEPKE